MSEPLPDDHHRDDDLAVLAGADDQAGPQPREQDRLDIDPSEADRPPPGAPGLKPVGVDLDPQPGLLGQEQRGAAEEQQKGNDQQKVARRVGECETDRRGSGHCPRQPGEHQQVARLHEDDDPRAIAGAPGSPAAFATPP